MLFEMRLRLKDQKETISVYMKAPARIIAEYRVMKKFPECSILWTLEKPTSAAMPEESALVLSDNEIDNNIIKIDFINKKKIA